MSFNKKKKEPYQEEALKLYETFKKFEKHKICRDLDQMICFFKNVSEQGKGDHKKGIRAAYFYDGLIIGVNKCEDKKSFLSCLKPENMGFLYSRMDEPYRSQAKNAISQSIQNLTNKKINYHENKANNNYMKHIDEDDKKENDNNKQVKNIKKSSKKKLSRTAYISNRLNLTFGGPEISVAYRKAVSEIKKIKYDDDESYDSDLATYYISNKDELDVDEDCEKKVKTHVNNFFKEINPSESKTIEAITKANTMYENSL